MNFAEEIELRKLWKEEYLTDPLNIVRSLFETFARILSIENEEPAPVNDKWWVVKQLQERGAITEEWFMEADSITDVFINNTKVIWFPESIQNPNFDTIARSLKTKVILQAPGRSTTASIYPSGVDGSSVNSSVTIDSSFETALISFTKHFNHQDYFEHVISEYSDPKAVIYKLQIATIMFKEPPRTCVIINDLLFPKNLKVDKSVRKFGSDAVRLHLLEMVSLNKDFNFKEISSLKTNIITPFQKSYKILQRFFNWEEKHTGSPFRFNGNSEFVPGNFIEEYVLSSVETLKSTLLKEMQRFRVHISIKKIETFVHNFYVSLQKTSPNSTFLKIFFKVMLEFLKTASMFLPFTTESIYQKLRPYLVEGSPNSVLDYKFPSVDKTRRDKRIELSTERLFNILAMVGSIRKRANLPLKYQLPKLWIVIKDYKYYEGLVGHIPFIAKNVNVETVQITTNRRQFRIAMKAKPLPRRLERRFDLHLKEILRFVENLSDNDMNLFSSTGEVRYLDFSIFLSDVTLSYSIPEEMDKTFQAESNSEFVVILDTTRKQEDIEMEKVLEIVKHIKRVEDKVGFEDGFGIDCVMNYKLLNIANKYFELISESVKGKLALSENVTFDMNYEYEETVNVGKSQVLIVIYKIGKNQ